MKKVIKVILLFIFESLPLTHFYKFKARILNTMGMNIALSARIISSVKFLGIENIIIGDDTFIGHDTLITGSNKSSVTIGANCDISSRVTIVTGTHEININGKHIAGKGISKDIVIGNGVWIGINATILPGVNIGNKSIVAAGAVVTQDIPQNVMVAGNPAIVKKKLIAGELNV